MLVHASCKPTEQAVNTFYPFLSLFFNALFFSAEMLSPLQHWFTLTWAGPARQGRGGTASYDSWCSASFSHQAYRSTMVSTPTAAFHHCKLSPLFLQLEEAILVYPQDFFVKVADVQTYVPLHTPQQQFQENHVSTSIRSEAEAVPFVKVISCGDADTCFSQDRTWSILWKICFLPHIWWGHIP